LVIKTDLYGTAKKPLDIAVSKGDKQANSLPWLLLER
jgi:hypothetical protein